MEFSTVFKAYVKSLQQQTDQVETATNENAIPYNTNKTTTCDEVVESVQNMNIFRGVSELKSALYDCYNFTGISRNNYSDSDSSQLAELIKVAKQIATCSDEVLANAEQMAVDLGYEEFQHSNPARELHLDLGSGSEQQPRTPFAARSDILNGCFTGNSMGVATKASKIRRGSDPPTPSLEDVGISAESLAVLGKENNNSLFVRDTSTSTKKFALTPSRLNLSSFTSTCARLQPNSCATPGSELNGKIVSQSVKKQLWLTPARPTHSMARDDLPDLIGESDSEDDSTNILDEQLHMKSAIHEQLHMKSAVNEQHATESAVNEQFDNNNVTIDELDMIHFNLSHVSELDFQEKVPSYLESQMNKESMNNAIDVLNANSSNGQLLVGVSDSYLANLLGLDPRKAKMLLLGLVKVNRIRMVNTNVFVVHVK